MSHHLPSFAGPPSAPISPDWILRQWPPTACVSELVQTLQFQHLSTFVTQVADVEQPALGQTVWHGDSELGRIGLAWDWVCLSEGIVAMLNPMSLVSNLQVVDAQGRPVTPFEAVRKLNGIVHALPWQIEVQWALNEQRSSQVH